MSAPRKFSIDPEEFAGKRALVTGGTKGQARPSFTASEPGAPRLSPRRAPRSRPVAGVDAVVRAVRR